jgi:branched-chain amino acid transport system substrate-binding protein
MLRQIEQLGMDKVRFLGGDGICTAEIAKLSGGAKTLDNVVCATGGASLDKMPGGKAWKERYDRKFPGQFQVYSPYAYDATFVLVDAMKRANSTDPKVYLPLLPSTDLQGVTARIQFQPNGELKNPATTLFTYRGGVKTALQ